MSYPTGREVGTCSWMSAFASTSQESNSSPDVQRGLHVFDPKRLMYRSQAKRTKMRWEGMVMFLLRPRDHYIEGFDVFWGEVEGDVRMSCHFFCANVWEGRWDERVEMIQTFDLWDTLPKTNIAPENRPLEKELPIGNHHFQVLS